MHPLAQTGITVKGEGIMHPYHKQCSGGCN